MAGRTVTLLPFTEFDFSQLKTSGITRLYPRLVDLRRWRNGTLLVRVRDANIGLAGSFVEASLVREAPDLEAPEAFFRDLNGAFGTTLISGPLTTAEALYQAPLTSDAVALTSWARLRVIARQQTQDAALSFTLSIDVSLRD